jgi:hypothetical protein
MSPSQERRLRSLIRDYRNDGWDDHSISRAVHNLVASSPDFTSSPRIPASVVNRFLHNEGLPQLSRSELNDPEFQAD